MKNSKTATVNNWQTHTLGHLGKYLNGRAFSKSEWKKSGLPIIRIQNLNNDKAPFNYGVDKYEERYRIRKGDILVSWSASLGVYIWNRTDGWLNQHIFKVIPNTERIKKQLLFYVLKNAINELYFKTHGTGMVHITKPKFENHKVSIPSDKRKQELLVNKLDSYLPQVREAKSQIQSAMEILVKFRQAVLNAAVTGKLTEDWREKSSLEIKVGDVVSNIENRRIKQAKTKSQKNKIEDTYSFKEKNNSRELPESWKYFALNKLCESFQYGTSKKSEREGKVPVLRMGNLQDGEIDWSNLVFTSEKTEIDKFLLKSGTVLFNRTNSPELVGKTSIYRGRKPAIFAGYLIRVNNFEELDSEYLNYCLNSYHAKKYYRKVKTDGVSQSNINAQKLGKFEVPFCSLEEQKEIVRLIKSLFDKADEVERQIINAESRVEKLTQSILAKAFKGELIN